MTTDITELAQRNELLIANGQLTADLLRHLADNEIDSDYFAVVSECESYGKETDAELSITEFALRAAGYVDELVDALEKAQQRIAELEDAEQKLCAANVTLDARAELAERQLAEMALAAMDSESGCLPLDYLQGHKDGLEWAAQLAEANHPETGDWLYDDPIELAKAIRKGPDMPPAQSVADSEPVIVVGDDGGDALSYRRLIQSFEPGTKLYRHAQPAPVEATVVDDVKTIIRILNDNDWSDTEGFRGIKTHIGKSLESWIDRIIDQIKPSGLRPDEIKKYIRETLIENGLYDGLRLALSNAGIAAPESDEMLAVKQERYVQELVTWVRDRKPFQPPPVVPDGYVMVPKEPTKEMLDEFDSIIDYGAEDSQDAWRRLLAAAPQSPGSEPATVPGKWIPVSERMPEDRTQVILWDAEIGEVTSGHYSHKTQTFYHCGDAIENEITHWMLPPSAPQGVKP